MKIVKNSIKYLLISLCFAVIGFLVYKKTPSEVEFYVAEGPNEALIELLNIAERGVPINPDPYASSTYRPGDVLYDAMLVAQDGYTYDARDMMQVLAKEGNVDALFFTGMFTYSYGVDIGGRTASFFSAAAKLGNPYAALMLDTNNPKCTNVMPKYCEAKWGELGRKILRDRAAQGDAKAGYALYLNIQDKKPSFSYLFDSEYESKGQGPFQVLLKAAKDGIKQHYYKPLGELLRLYNERTSLRPFTYDNIPLTKKERTIILKVAEIAINNNDIRFIMVQEGFPERYGKQLASTVERIVDLVDFSTSYFSEKYLISRAKENRYFAVRGFAYAIASEKEREGGDLPLTSKGYGVYFDASLENAGIPHLSEQEKSAARVLAKQHLENYAPILYYDENTTL